jgi:hypothetical protein
MAGKNQAAPKREFRIRAEAKPDEGAMFYFTLGDTV